MGKSKSDELFCFKFEPHSLSTPGTYINHVNLIRFTRKGKQEEDLEMLCSLSPSSGRLLCKCAKFKAIVKGTAKALKAQELPAPPRATPHLEAVLPALPQASIFPFQPLGPPGDYHSNFIMCACPVLVSTVQLHPAKGTKKIWVQTEMKEQKGNRTRRSFPCHMYHICSPCL